jgi:hypothetical protein
LNKSKYIAIGLLLSSTLMGCAHVREWKLPTQGTIAKPPQALVECIQDAFKKQQSEHRWNLLQRTSKSASGEILWDQVDSSNSLMHRVVIFPAKNAGESNYRVDGGPLGLVGLGFIESCFQ